MTQNSNNLYRLGSLYFPIRQCLFLNSKYNCTGLTRIMATSREYDELYWAWDSWRDAVGAPARQDYGRYVELKNIGAMANGKM